MFLSLVTHPPTPRMNTHYWLQSGWCWFQFGFSPRWERGEDAKNLQFGASPCQFPHCFCYSKHSAKHFVAVEYIQFNIFTEWTRCLPTSQTNVVRSEITMIEWTAPYVGKPSLCSCQWDTHAWVFLFKLVNWYQLTTKITGRLACETTHQAEVA